LPFGTTEAQASSGGFPLKSPQLVEPEAGQMASDAAILYEIVRFKKAKGPMPARNIGRI
jgi:hypothetical protein